MPAAITPVSTASFVAANGTDLSTLLTGEGDAWAVHSSYTGTLVIASNALVRGAANNAAAYYVNNLASYDGTIAFTFTTGSNPNASAPRAVEFHVSSAADTRLRLTFAGTGNLKWEKVVAGVVTSLGTQTCTLASSTTYTVAVNSVTCAGGGFGVNQTSLSATVNGVTTTAADTVVFGPGYVGISWGTGTIDGTITAWQAVNAPRTIEIFRSTSGGGTGIIAGNLTAAGQSNSANDTKYVSCQIPDHIFTANYHHAAFEARFPYANTGLGKDASSRDIAYCRTAISSLNGVNGLAAPTILKSNGSASYTKPPTGTGPIIQNACFWFIPDGSVLANGTTVSNSGHGILGLSLVKIPTGSSDANCSAGLTGSTATVFIQTSNDEGATWGAEVEVTFQVKETTWRAFFWGPGNAFDFDPATGLLFCAACHSVDNGEKYFGEVLVSQDGGQNWERRDAITPGGIGNIGGDLTDCGSYVGQYVSEAQIAVVHGDLYVNVRPSSGPTDGSGVANVYRQRSYSCNAGRSVHGYSKDTAIKDPIVTTGWLSDKVPLNTGVKGSLLLTSYPNEQPGAGSQTSPRDKGTLRFSTDRGNTWNDATLPSGNYPGGTRFCQGNFGYSALRVHPTTGDIYCMYSTGMLSPTEAISMAVIPRAWAAIPTAAPAPAARPWTPPALSGDLGDIRVGSPGVNATSGGVSALVPVLNGTLLAYCVGFHAQLRGLATDTIDRLLLPLNTSANAVKPVWRVSLQNLDEVTTGVGDGTILTSGTFTNSVDVGFNNSVLEVAVTPYTVTQGQALAWVVDNPGATATGSGNQSFFGGVTAGTTNLFESYASLTGSTWTKQPSIPSWGYGNSATGVYYGRPLLGIFVQNLSTSGTWLEAGPAWRIPSWLWKYYTVTGMTIMTSMPVSQNAQFVVYDQYLNVLSTAASVTPVDASATATFRYINIPFTTPVVCRGGQFIYRVGMAPTGTANLSIQGITTWSRKHMTALPWRDWFWTWQRASGGKANELRTTRSLMELWVTNVVSGGERGDRYAAMMGV